MSDGDFRWLIEAPGQHYLSARELAGHEFYWTKDSDKALCFKSREQADLTMMAVRQLVPALFGFETTLGNAWPKEHGWLSAPPPKPGEVTRMSEAALKRIAQGDIIPITADKLR